MANQSDDFFNSFAAAPAAAPVKKTPIPAAGVTTTTGTNTKVGGAMSKSGVAPSGLSSASAAAAAYHAASSGMPPPPPVRAAASNTSTTASTSSRPAVRPHIRSAASRPTGTTTGTAGIAPATTTASGSGNTNYYGAAASYKAPSNSNTSSATTTNPSYYASAVNVNASATTTTSTSTSSLPPSAPNPYGGYAAPAPPPAFHYGAPASTTNAAAATTPYNYGQPAAAAAAAVPPVPAHPQVMNPYLLSSAAPTDAFSGAMDTNATFNGPMDTGAAAVKPSTFIPQLSSNNNNNTTGFLSSSSSSGLITTQPYNPADFEDDPPLLEELGINIEHIVAKMRSVVLPFSRFKGTISDATVIQDADLAGPIALGLLLGGELMLSGKLQFGYIYGFGLFGCISMTLVLNFMSPHDAISVWTVTSILGYSLLPVNLLAAVKLVVVNLGNLQLLGQFLGFLTVVWCTVASTRLMEQGCDMRDQRYLIAYPIGLLYTAFVMITIF